ncbi:amidohydrolase [Polynucleobacter sp. UK-Kesae-W10]|uniref:amidohydrolase n=1 Tax=Polynucleobacter sp. UK-Kesae-W10 TaxID=1819738 RepID=UPI001C0B66AA|nr:amidohydrolase [Polynucleobacter sp. UK-Kesae-W10]MBU3577870.1 amidohydrolase family protein [Polynucleobacter sp. UK-Kesae-W10]
MKRFIQAALISAGLIAIHQSAFAAQAADTIFYGGPILTVNAKNEEVQALAVQNGKIVAVGKKEAVTKEWKGDATKVIDLNGQTLMPGFVEPHIHILMTAMTEVLWLNLSNFTTQYDTLDSLSQKLKTALKTLPKGQWLAAFGVDPSRTVPFMAELNADILDKVSTEVPILVMNQSGHIAYVNHKALEIAGITDKTPNPGEGGIYMKDAQGRLTGVVVEASAILSIVKNMPPPTDAELAGAMQKTAKYIASKGVTTSAEITLGLMLGLDNELKLFNAVTHSEDFPIRVRAYLYGPLLANGKNTIKPNQGDDRLRFVGVKFVSDGSTQGITAALNEPYTYPKGSTFRGNLDYQDEEIYKQIKPIYDQGWQLAIHANGDRTVEQTLNNYAKLLEGNPDPKSRRLRIEHFTINTPDQVKRAAKLGVIPGFTIGHVDYWGEAFHNHIVGPERADRIDPSASFKKEGARFAYHSDSPVSNVGPLNYISEGAGRLWQKAPRKVLGPDERVTVDDAIRAVTINPAYEMFSDDKVGSLEVGKQADLVVLSANPKKTPVDEIRSIQVKETWIDGKKQVW